MPSNKHLSVDVLGKWRMDELNFGREAARFLLFLKVLEHRLLGEDHDEAFGANNMEKIECVSLQFLELRNGSLPSSSASCAR